MFAEQITLEKSRIPNRKIQFNRIKTLLTADIQRFCKCDLILRSLRMSNQVGLLLSDLRKIVSGLKYGEETVYAAIALAIYNDPSGLLVLKNHQKYWSSHSEIEKLHVRAALILLRSSISEKYQAVNKDLSPDLYRETML